MTLPTRTTPYRVIQWTTGNIGRRSLRAIIARPDMELVEVYAHGATLADLPPVTGRARG